jgi:hypothetical protein
VALKLKKILKKNPQDLTKAKWYLTLEKTGTVGLHEIAKEIEGRSALSLGDVQSVLSNMVEVLPIFFETGAVRQSGGLRFVPCVGFQRWNRQVRRFERPPCQRHQAVVPAEWRLKAQPCGYWF